MISANEYRDHLRQSFPIAATTASIMALLPFVFLSSVCGGMLGSRIQLEAFAPTFSEQRTTRPVAKITASETEFPNVSQYSVAGGPQLIDVDIDLLDASITIRFKGPGRFAEAKVNTYVFTNIDDTIPDFTGFSLDQSVSNLAIPPSQVTFSKNQLFINVSGVSYNSNTVAKFNVRFADSASKEAGSAKGGSEQGAPTPNNLGGDLASLRKAAEAGDNNAMCDIGDRYRRGEGVLQDFDQAVAWYRRAAEKGDMRAVTKLGACYEAGVGVAKDLSEAARCYRKAADAGYSKRMANLGDAYHEGPESRKI